MSSNILHELIYGSTAQSYEGKWPIHVAVYDLVNKFLAEGNRGTFIIGTFLIDSQAYNQIAIDNCFRALIPLIKTEQSSEALQEFNTRWEIVLMQTYTNGLCFSCLVLIHENDPDFQT